MWINLWKKIFVIWFGFFVKIFKYLKNVKGEVKGLCILKCVYGNVIVRIVDLDLLIY